MGVQKNCEDNTVIVLRYDRWKKGRECFAISYQTEFFPRSMEGVLVMISSGFWRYNSKDI